MGNQCDASLLLNLFVSIAPAEVFRLLQRQSRQLVRNGIYSAQLVIWMMIQQRLQAGGTVARSVEQLLQGCFAPLLSRCKRVTEKRIGVGTSGYCQARQELSKLLLTQTLRLQCVNAQSADMADKEILVATLAYNLVRTFMFLAAQRSGMDPRQLSFTYACNIVLDGYPGILAARPRRPTKATRTRRHDRLGRSLQALETQQTALLSSSRVGAAVSVFSSGRRPERF
jgi:hypothetical protein